MEKKFITGILASCFLLVSVTGSAQADKTDKNKSREKEIIIRSKGDKDSKMTIEINGDQVKVNGKPLSEFNNEDVSIIERGRIRRGEHNFLMAPPGGGNSFDFFNGDEDAPAKAFLGVISEKTNDGVKISEVLKESGAEKSGLKEGDIITKVDDKTIASPEDLMEAIRSHKPNDEVKIFYKREGKNSSLNVKLGETKQRVTIFKNFRGENDLGDSDRFNYNFRMPSMPGMPDLPNNHVRGFMRNNIKMGVKVEDAENNAGAKIIEVETGSAADKAGLKKDDLITEMNGEKVNDVNDLKSELWNRNNKENFTLKAKRNGSLMSFEIKIPGPVNSADL